MPKLQADVALEVAQNSARLLPPGPAPMDYVPTVVGTDPMQVAWQQHPDKELRYGHGDPNGELTAPKGTLYVEWDAPGLWQNDDGLTSWVEVGGTGAAGSFPISYDDGTYTYEITAVTGLLRATVFEDADPSNDAIIDLLPGQADISAGAGMNLISSETGAAIDIRAVNDGIISLAGGDAVEINTAFGDGDTLIGEITKEIGFFGSGSAGLQTVTGSRGGNAALASLLTALDALGLIVDGSS